MKTLSPKLIFLIVSLVIFSGGVLAQDGPPPPQNASQFDGQEPRPNLLENLGLSRDQIRQIRIMNRDRKPAMEAAQHRLRETNRALDMSIYGDALDENAVQARLKEFQQAQGEVARIRFQSELELRKILTPEQLVRFRGLRARLAEARQNVQQRRQMPPGERPVQRIRQLPNQKRVN
ncbi:MAG: periplasmic heavy metal sensor [Pyrinomonadaceae bacterium]